MSDEFPIKSPPLRVVQKDVILPKSANPIYDEGARLLGIEKYHKLYELMGEGKTYVIMDDGHNKHGNLSDPIEIIAYGFGNTDTPSGHGNSTNGIIGMIGNPILGPISKGKTVHKKVLGVNGGSPNQINKAFIDFLNSEHVYANASFGASGSFSHKPTEETLKKIKAANKIVCVASGNEYDDKVGWPANSPYVFAIGSVDFDENHALYSNSGDDLDFVIYGSNILAPNKSGGHDKITGTSAACPYALACIMAYHEYFERLFKYTPGWQETYDILKCYAKDLRDLGYDFKTGHGLITLRGIDDKFRKYILDYGRKDLAKMLDDKSLEDVVEEINKKPPNTKKKRIG